MKFGVGQLVRRKEDVRFLKGEGSFIADIAAGADALFAFFLRSPVAHGRIAAIDLSDARGAAGVACVYTGSDIAARLTPLANAFPMQIPGGGAPAPVTMPHLAADRVRFVGQPIAAVFAETLEAAKDAAESIELDFEDEPVVTDGVAALAPDAPLLHAEAPGNLAFDWEIGDREAVDAAFRDAAHVSRVRVVNQRLVVASMEPRAILIDYAAETGRWEARVGTQGSHGMSAKIAASLGVKADRVRVRTPDVGGAFGMKLANHPEYAVCALAAKELGRLIFWIGERGESFLSDAQGRDLVSDVEGAFDASGRLLAIRSEGVSNLGAYYSALGSGVHTNFSAPITGGMYALPCFHTRIRGVFTNTTPTDAYRGAGRPEVIFQTERLMDQAAFEMGIDPAEMRRSNLVTPEMLPHRTPGGMVFDSLDPHRNLDDAIALADRAGFEERRAEAKARGALRGLGLVYYMERTGGGPVENARIVVRGDGRIIASVGTQSTGQGHETAWAQLIADRLGVDFDAISIEPGDSDGLPMGGGTGGSRSAVMATRTFLLAAEDVAEKGREAAADLLEAAPADIEFSPSEGGCFRIMGTDRSASIFEIAASTEAGALQGDGAVGDRESTFPNGCHVAEVEIDPETGEARLLAYTIVDDFGVVLNPLLVAGQVHGGVAQGVGQILSEAAVWDAESGQPLTGSFMDYAMPRAGDVPSFAFALNETPCKTNPLGVKGCGEAGSVGAVPAVYLAALDALRTAGVADIAPPLTPLAIWSALRSAASTPKGD